MHFNFVVFVCFILAFSVLSIATEAVKEPLPMKTVAVCSSHPNCVSSVGTDKAHRMPPFRFIGPVGGHKSGFYGLSSKYRGARS